MIASFVMDPSAVRTFTIDWCLWPFPPAARIASILWTVPNSLEILDQSIVGSKANLKLRWTGLAIPGQSYEVECHMATTEPSLNPSEDSRRISILCLQR